MRLKSNSNNPMHISSTYATQTKPSTWTNRTSQIVTPGLRLKTRESSHEDEGPTEDVALKRINTVSHKTMTMALTGAHRGRRTEENKHSVTQNNHNDFNSPFWNKARSKVNKSLGYNHRRHQSYARADSAPVNFCLYIAMKTTIAPGSADMEEKSNAMNVIVWATWAIYVICIHIE